jgi:phosphoglycolate phosphatase-like HAD superfamily hydrolase
VIRVAVFDFDGTLVDSNAIKRRCLDEVVADLPGGADALAIARRAGGDRYAMFAAVARRLRPDADASDTATFGRTLADDYTRRCFTAIAAAPERRGAGAALDALARRGVRLWVASATPERDLAPLLRARGIDALFEGALGSPRTKLQSLRTVLEAEGVSPRQTVMVGDGDDDAAAAARAGTWYVAVTAERPAPRYTPFAMPDLERLPATIGRLGAGEARSP